MLKLDNRIALVTGCGSSRPGWGIGKAISTLLARQGALVLGIDRDLELADQTRKIIQSEGGKIEVLQCDVCEGEQVRELFSEIAARHGRLDILINSVGQSEPGEPATMEDSVWHDQIRLNLTSAFFTVKYALPLMTKTDGGGAIVNVASVAGMRWVGKDQAGYAAAKAGLIQFTRATAVAYAQKGIRLNCVVPGLMLTPLVGRLAERYADGDYGGMVARRNSAVPMGRMGDAWDVANAALFLASDEAKYITGTTLVVDGGLTASTGSA